MTRFLKTRVSSEVAADLSDLARRAGAKVSDLVREALEHQLPAMRASRGIPPRASARSPHE